MQQVIDDLLNGDLMVFYRKRFFDLVLAEDLIIGDSVFGADPFAKAFRFEMAGFRIDQLEFNR